MLPTDPLTGPLFGITKEDGLVFFPYTIRTVPVPVTEGQVERLRSATMVAAVIFVVLLIGAAAFVAGYVLIWIFSGHAPVVFGVTPLWLLLMQAGFIVLTATLYDMNIRRILKTP